MVVLFICLKMGLGDGGASPGGDASAGTLPMVGVGR